MLGVHLVLGDIVDLDRSEGAKPYMKGDVADVHALGADAVEQLVCEVESRGRRGCRTELV